MPTPSSMEITPANRAKIIALLREGTCPICGRQGLTCPLLHIAKAHGIPHREFKKASGVGMRRGFISPELCLQKREAALRNKCAERILQTPRSTPDIRQVGQLKPVVRVNADGTTTNYRSVSEAARQNGVTKNAISNCLRGVAKTCAGCRWEYK